MPLPLLSKSDFMNFRKCPEAFWYSKYDPDKLEHKPLTPFEEQIIEQGKEVEAWARKLFTAGVLIAGYGDEALSATQEEIKKASKAIFQATFSDGHLFAMADIIVWNVELRGWDIYEVKGSSSRDGGTKKADHYWDLAFQRETFDRAGVKTADLFLIEVNSDFHKNGKINPSDLLKVSNVTDEIDSMSVEIQQYIASAQTELKRQVAPTSCECISKPRKQHCSAFRYFYPNISTYTTFDISRISSSKLKVFDEDAIYKIEDIPEDNDLSDIQYNQVLVNNNDFEICDTAGIKKELSSLVYPLYFLDYETHPVAVPVFDGCYPYQQVPFQYSLHIQEIPGSELIHKEYLHSDDGHPIVGLSASLRNDISDIGSVIVWNKTFESKCNYDMAAHVPDLSEFLLGINDRIYDLEVPFRDQLVVMKEFKGRTSIKFVLPALVPELSYKHLNIQDGGAACSSWQQIYFSDLDEEQVGTIKNDLLAYCKLDTLAMVEILNYLRKIP